MICIALCGLCANAEPNPTGPDRGPKLGKLALLLRQPPPRDEEAIGAVAMRPQRAVVVLLQLVRPEGRGTVVRER